MNYPNLLVEAVEPLGGFASLGISTGMASLVLYFWRQDRKDRAEERKAADERHQVLAKDFKEIVQGNTIAMTRLTDSLSGRVICPLATSRGAQVGEASAAR